MSQGHFLSRRTFTQKLLGGCAALGLNALLRPTVSFATPCVPTAGPIKTYIKINLSGGADGLTMFIPRDNRFAALQSLRPALMGGQHALQCGGRGFGGDYQVPNSLTGLVQSVNQIWDISCPFGVHPSLGPQPEMTAQGLKSIGELLKLRHGRILSKYGFPSPNLDHVAASRHWNLGEDGGTGGISNHYLGRLREQFNLDWYQLWFIGGAPNYRHPPGLNRSVVASQLSELRRFSVPDPQYNRLQGSTLGGPTEIDAAQLTIQRLLELPDEANTSEAEREYKEGMLSAWEVMNDLTVGTPGAPLDPSARQNIARLQQVSLPAYFPAGLYPNIDVLFADALKVIHQYRIAQSSCVSTPLMINIDLFGFDTHGFQECDFHLNLKAISHCVGALHRFLTEAQLWDQTMIHFTSEFGREIRQNENFGTSHGWGNMLPILGGMFDRSPSAQLVFGGESYLPSLQEIQGGVTVQGQNMKVLPAILDARAVNWSIIEGMGFDPAAVFSSYSPPAGTPSLLATI